MPNEKKPGHDWQEAVRLDLLTFHSVDNGNSPLNLSGAGHESLGIISHFYPPEGFEQKAVHL